MEHVKNASLHKEDTPQESAKRLVPANMQIQHDLTWLEIDSFETDLNERYRPSDFTEIGGVESLLDSLILLQHVFVYDKASADVDLDPIRKTRVNPATQPTRFSADWRRNSVKLCQEQQRNMPKE
jgi:hypothetical protein